MALFFCLFALMGRLQAQPTEDDIRSLGTGLWCWQLKGKASDAALMAAKASAYGIGSVRLKAHDGMKIFRDEPRVPRIAKAMHAKGIKVLLWGFNYASHVADEAQLICGFLDQPWCDGYIFDTEAPLTSRWDATAELVELVRQHRDNCPICQNKLLGFAPYAFPSLHRNLNYAALVENTDFIEPQMYWATMGRSVKSVVGRTYQEWLAFERDNGVSKPIIPLGQSYEPKLDINGQGELNPDDLVEFGKLTRGYYAVSFYLWPQSQDLWGAIGKVAQGRAGDWQEVGQDPQPLPATTAARPWYAAWWHAWMAVYQAGVISLLLGLMILLVLLELERERAYTAAIGVGIAFLWPYLLAGSLTIIALAVIVTLVYLAAGWGWYAWLKYCWPSVRKIF